MRAKPLLLSLVFSISFLIARAQGTWLLTNQKGVSLSYDKEFFLYCEEFKTDIYKITAYFANNSGKSIQIPGAFIWHGMRHNVGDHCHSQMPKFFPWQAKFRINGVWATQSLLTLVYYMEVPKGQPVPDPIWHIDEFLFVENPKTTQPTTPQWSPWISDNCFRRIKYKYMGKELMNLNYQYHYYFQATNNYTETIFFVLSLKDATGNERFGTRRSIAPGKTIEFVEKMDQDYIKEMAVENVCFKIDDSKYLACDHERGLKPPTYSREEIIADTKKALELGCLEGKYEAEWLESPKETSEAENKRLEARFEKAKAEAVKFVIYLNEKYSEEKNKAASDIYNKYWNDHFYDCPTPATRTHG